MNAALSPTDRARLARVLGMLGSDHAGERDAAALAANKIVRSAGITWPDILLAEPASAKRSANQSPSAPPFYAECNECLRRSGRLTVWELEFISTLSVSPRATQRQLEKLEQILTKVRA